MIVLQFLKASHLSFLRDFVSYQSLKIGCVNYGSFCNSDHILPVISFDLAT